MTLEEALEFILTDPVVTIEEDEEEGEGASELPELPVTV